MQRVLEELSQEAQVCATVVWVHVLAADDEQAARAAARRMHMPRMRHFYDHHQYAARQMADVLGGEGYFAWDTYLVFAKYATWRDKPPFPADWVHQLDNTAWAPAHRRKKGWDLIKVMQAMLLQA